MARSSRSHWEHELKRAKIDYVFRAYVRQGGEHWPTRHGKLRRLAESCGAHRQWDETIAVESDIEQWIVWAFKDHRHKLAFEAGVPAIMAQEFVSVPFEMLSMAERLP